MDQGQAIVVRIAWTTSHLEDPCFRFNLNGEVLKGNLVLTDIEDHKIDQCVEYTGVGTVYRGVPDTDTRKIFIRNH